MIRVKSDTFIIFSTSKDNSGATVRYAPEIFSDYGIASVSGGIGSGAVRITPNGTGWSVSCDFRAHGSFSFEAEITENPPEDGVQGATKTVTLYALVYGKDRPMIGKTFYQFAVGEEVNITGISGVCAQTFFDVAIHGAGPLKSVEGYESGLTVYAVQEEGGTKNIAAKIIGTAARPGLYSFSVTTNSVTPQHETNPFPPGPGTDTIFVSIYDPCGAGTPMVLDLNCKYHFNPDSFRIITHAVADSGAERLTGSFARSGAEWIRNESRSQLQYTQFWEYKIVPEDSAWNLYGRSYFSGDTVPEWKHYATAPAIADCDVPPSAGWSEGVIAMGAVRYFVGGHGFFDRKTDTLYQSSPHFVREFEGWEQQPGFPGGEFMALENGVWKIDGETVNPAAISGAALPYSPPRFEDLAAGPLNFNKFPEQDKPAFLSGGSAAGFWEHYPALRQLHPTTPRPAATVQVTASYTLSDSETSDSSYQSWTNLDDYHATSTGSSGSVKSHSISKQASAAIALPAVRMDADLVGGLYGTATPGVSHTETHVDRTWYTSSSSSSGTNSEPFSTTSTTTVDETSTVSPGEISDSSASGSVSFGSGKNPQHESEMLFVSGFGEVNAAWQANVTTRKTETRITNGSPEAGFPTSSSSTSQQHASVSGSLGVLTPAAFRPGDPVPVPGASAEEVTASYWVNWNLLTQDENGDMHTTGTEWAATHSHTGRSDDPASWQGSTTVTAGGVSTVTDDPRGELYAALVSQHEAEVPEMPEGGTARSGMVRLVVDKKQRNETTRTTIGEQS